MRKRTRIIQDKRRRTRCAQLAADAFDEKLISVREEDGRTEIIMEGDAVTDMCGSTLFIQEPDTGDIFSENLKINLYSYRPGEGKKLAVPNIYGFYPVQKGESFCFTRLGENTDGQALCRCQEYSWYMTEGIGAQYMTVAKVDDVFQPAESRMYRFALTDNKLSSLSECAAEGYAIGMTIVREPCLCRETNKRNILHFAAVLRRRLIL